LRRAPALYAIKCSSAEKNRPWREAFMTLRRASLALVVIAALTACADEPFIDAADGGLLREPGRRESAPTGAVPAGVRPAIGQNRIYQDRPGRYEFTDEEYRLRYPHGYRRGDED
jgi:hypothetical protein